MVLRGEMSSGKSIPTHNQRNVRKEVAQHCWFVSPFTGVYRTFRCRVRSDRFRTTVARRADHNVFSSRDQGFRNPANNGSFADSAYNKIAEYQASGMGRLGFFEPKTIPSQIRFPADGVKPG
jgi:hypothetical protein